MRVSAFVAAMALLLVAAGPVAAAQKTGCPAAEGWNQMTIVEAATAIWPELLDRSVFPGGQADLEAALAGFDRNGDGDLCIKISGGDDLNPNSHWYRVGVEVLGSPTMFFIPSDNNRGADD